jgi:hypothetical protein
MRKMTGNVSEIQLPVNPMPSQTCNLTLFCEVSRDGAYAKAAARGSESNFSAEAACWSSLRRLYDTFTLDRES